MFKGPVWKLHRDPFYPDGDGTQPYKPSAVERWLDPLADPRVVSLYFDVYDWSFSHPLHGIAPGGVVQKFPTSRMLMSDSPLLILMSGQSQTGIDSLANLMLHEIGKATGRNPRAVDVKLESRDKDRNVVAVARAFIDTIDPVPSATPDPVLQRLETRFDRLQANIDARRDPMFASVFEALKPAMQAGGEEVVLRIKKGGDDISWAHIQEHISPCCNYLIVMTSDAHFANTFYDARGTRNVVWIRAEPLDLAKARRYVDACVRAQRVGGSHAALDLFPFTDAAIDALFEQGSTARAHQTVRHPVGWLRKTLHEALAESCRQPASAGPDLIDAQHIRQARAALNGA